MSTVFKTKPVRCLFSHLTTAHAYNQGEQEKFDITILINKSDNETLSRIQDAIQTDKLHGSVQDLVIDCDKDPKYSQRKECAGCYVMNLKSQYKPKIYDKNGERINKDAYTGEYVIIMGSVYQYTFARKTGISCNLRNVMLSGKGEEIEQANPFADEIEQDPFKDCDLPF